MTREIADKVRAIVRPFGFDEESGTDTTALCFATRDAGDIENECPGRADILAARALRKEILATVPGVDATIDTCDEWVNLTVRTVKP